MRKSLKKIRDEALKRRYRNKLSIRAKINGSEERPRICAIKTNKHLTVQVIDDVKSQTLFSMNTFGKNAIPGASKSVEGAKILGVKVADEFKKRGIKLAVFDRNGRPYKGILASLANSIRENGISF